MKKYLSIAAVAALLMCITAGNSQAGFGVGVSIGKGFYFPKGFEHTPFNAEVIPSYKISMVSIDLGVVVDFENKIDFSLRPGIRAELSSFYGRLAIPLKLTNGFDYGFVIGLGWNMLKMGMIKLFLEVDGTLSKHFGWLKNVPIELRVGARFDF